MRQWWKIVTILAFVAIFYGHGLASDYTAKDLVSGCRNFVASIGSTNTLSDAFDQGICVGEVRTSMSYQTGIARLVAGYRHNKVEFPRKLMGISFLVGFPACPSKTSSVLDGIQYLVRYADEHPDQLNRNMEVFTQEALADAFPCTPEALSYFEKN